MAADHSINYQDVISEILVFIEVVNSGSLVGASKKLGLSKPSVSRKINLLEEHLGAQLLRRTTRKITPTSQGQLLYDQCSFLPFIVERAIQNIQEVQSSPTGELKIGFASYFANDFNSMQIVAGFMQLYPGVTVQVHSFTKSEDVDPVKSEVDLYFTDHDMTNSTLLSEPFTKYKIRACASSSYLAAHGVPQTPLALVDHNCLLHHLYEKPQSQWKYKNNGQEAVVNVGGSIYASRTHFIVKLARTGMGIALLPEFMINKYVRQGELQYILEEYDFYDSEIFITTYRSKRKNLLLTSFINYVRQAML